MKTQVQTGRADQSGTHDKQQARGSAQSAATGQPTVDRRRNMKASNRGSEQSAVSVDCTVTVD